MAQSAANHVVWILVFMLAVAIAGATPPGIAKGVATAKCMNEKFKTCNNLVHVCPKFCPDGCYVHCRSCKPICNGTEPPPDFETDPESRYPPPLPATTLSPPPPTITLSPPPPTITPSPPPPIIIPSPPPTITMSPPLFKY